MDEGRIIEEGSVFSVFASPKEKLTQDFINTTSNLYKIEEFIEAGEPVVATKPGECIVRLTYLSEMTADPVISMAAQKFGVLLSILFANVEIVQGSPIGGTVCLVSGDGEKIEQALAFMEEHNVRVEVIKDDRLSVSDHAQRP